MADDLISLPLPPPQPPRGTRRSWPSPDARRSRANPWAPPTAPLPPPPPPAAHSFRHDRDDDHDDRDSRGEHDGGVGHDPARPARIALPAANVVPLPSAVVVPLRSFQPPTINGASLPDTHDDLDDDAEDRFRRLAAARRRRGPLAAIEDDLLDERGGTAEHGRPTGDEPAVHHDHDHDQDQDAAGAPTTRDQRAAAAHGATRWMFGERLDATCYMQRDRLAPNGRTRIGFVVVGPSGVWLVEQERAAGHLDVRSERHVRTGRRLLLGGQDHTVTVDRLIAAAGSLKPVLRGSDVKVQAAVCIVSPGASPRGRAEPTRVRGVWVLDQRQLAELLCDGELGEAEVADLASRLFRRWPAAL